ncbi:MAG: hypothetical protein HOW73_01975 [Polyangiaceae bacterium]|nr:hypothetical protein [Polyangiaceae bacterium]
MKRSVELLRNRHVVITDQSASRTVCVKRTAAPFVTIPEMQATFTEICRILDDYGRATANLIVDTRDAPPRNDPEFEVAFGPLRTKMLQGFRKVAILVSTPIGRLQVQRHAREDGLPLRMFSDEDEARAYCLGRPSP